MIGLNGSLFWIDGPYKYVLYEGTLEVEADGPEGSRVYISSQDIKRVANMLFDIADELEEQDKE